MPQKKNQYIFLVMGPQGSGKGTQAELLAKKFNLKQVTSGDMLRRLARQNTPFGRQVNLTINQQGRLVPWQWIIKMAAAELKKIPAHRGLVFDGLARRLPEAKAFAKMLKKTGRQISAVFLIDISARETVKRLSQRRQCTNGHIFTVGVSLKKNQKKCPKCGVKIFQRADDRPVAIRKRLQDYRQKTLPAVNYFKKLGWLVKIDGQQPIKKVFADILKAIKKLER